MSAPPAKLVAITLARCPALAVENDDRFRFAHRGTAKPSHPCTFLSATAESLSVTAQHRSPDMVRCSGTKRHACTPIYVNYTTIYTLVSIGYPQLESVVYSSCSTTSFTRFPSAFPFSSFIITPTI